MDIARNILLLPTNDDFTTNFMQLLAVPLVQIESELDKYKEMLKAVREFLVITNIPLDEVFGAKEGFSVLHYMAALTPPNQFRAFCEEFGDLIPREAWTQEHGDISSPIEILQGMPDLKIQNLKEHLAKKLDVDMAVSAKSPSDILHRPGDLSRAHCHGDVVEMEGEAVPAYPLKNYEIVIGVGTKEYYKFTDRRGEDRVFTQEQFNRIAEFIPSGES